MDGVGGEGRLKVFEQIQVLADKLFQRFLIHKKDQTLVIGVDGFIHRVATPLEEEYLAFVDVQFLRGRTKFLFSFEHDNNGVFFKKNLIPFGIYVATVGHKRHLGAIGPLNVQRLKLIGLDGGGDAKHGRRLILWKVLANPANCLHYSVGMNKN